VADSGIKTIAAAQS